MMNTNTRYWQRLAMLVGVFLRIGAVGFGGALAHDGLMEDAFVRRHQRLTQETFHNGLALANMLPGATSVQLAVYIGYVEAGVLGGICSGIAFIFPAFVLMVVLSWAYLRYGTFPAIGAVFVAVGPVVVSIIGNMLYGMSKRALTTRIALVLGLGAFLLTILPVLPVTINLPTIIVVAGLLGVLLYGRNSRKADPRKADPRKTDPAHKSLAVKSFFPFLFPFLLPVEQLLAMTMPFLTIVLEFLKIGVLLFTCGFLLVPLLQQELVYGLHWLTMRQLLDGVALGQLTPGPVTIVATFVGYKVAGMFGAVLASVAVYTPSFLLIFALAPVSLRLRNSPNVQSFLKGITPAVIGILAAAAVTLARSSLEDLWMVAIAVVSFVLLVRWKVNPIFLIGGAVLFGLIRFFI